MAQFISLAAATPIMQAVADLLEGGKLYGDVVEYVCLAKTVGLRDGQELARVYLRLLARQGNNAAYRCLATA